MSVIIAWTEYPPHDHPDDPWGIDFNKGEYIKKEYQSFDEAACAIYWMHPDNAVADIEILTPPKYKISVEIRGTIVNFFPDGQYSVGEQEKPKGFWASLFG